MPDTFDFLKSINEHKENLMAGDEDGQIEKSYQPFLINRFLSNFIDTALYANEVNIRHDMDARMQYEYLLHSIRQRKRYSKWLKPEVIADIDAVAEYFQYGKAKAKAAMDILSKDQIEQIKAAMYTGGTKKPSA